MPGHTFVFKTGEKTRNESRQTARSEEKVGNRPRPSGSMFAFYLFILLFSR